MISAGTGVGLFCLLCLGGIVAAPFVADRRNPAMLAWIGAVASLVLLATASASLLHEVPFQATLWSLPEVGELRISMDALAAYFIIATALVFLPVSIYTAGYLKRFENRYSLRAFSILYLGLFLCIVLAPLAADVLMFILAWEGMAILSYLLVNFESDKASHARAGYLMLAMGEAGTLAAMLALLYLANAANSLEFAAMKRAAGSLSHGGHWVVFVLSFFGFGVKAGLVPFNSWLPRAHPVAPGNVSALLSGVILNLGVYGIVRVNLDLAPPGFAGPGVVVLIVGAISAFLGILYATTENDLKAMLAHSSIENIGVVAAGMGAGMVFFAAGRPSLAAIAWLAALYHMGNHSVFKALLFLGAATVDQRVGTRDLDRLGGLLRQLPWTGFFFLVGALSISALPPFNGFVSEWLTLQALLRSVELSSTGIKLAFALSGAVLAVTAALAVACFVKAFGMGFLGIRRAAQSSEVTEAPASMRTGMAILAAVCLLLGVTPTYVAPAIDRVVTPIARSSAATALVPPFFEATDARTPLPQDFVEEFHDLGAQVGADVLPGRGLVVLHRGGKDNPVVFAMSSSYGAIVLGVLLVLAFGFARWLTRRRTVARGPRWDGGVRRLLPEMTYTATGFSNPVRVVFDAMLRPLTVEDTKETVAEHFRTAIRRKREDVHIVDRYMAYPAEAAGQRIARLLARMHHGRVNAYVAYVLFTLLAFLIMADRL